MDKTYTARLIKNYWYQEITVESLSIPAMSYVVFICFPMARKLPVLFMTVIPIGAASVLLTGLWYRFLATRHIRKVVAAEDIDKVPHDVLVNAKKEAFRFPLGGAVCLFFRWVQGYALTVVPYSIIADAPFNNYIFIAVFFVFGGINTMLYVYLNTESFISDFLRLEAVGKIELSDKDSWRFSLPSKTILLVLMVLLPPMGYLINTVFICVYNNIPIHSVWLGFFLIIAQALILSIFSGIFFAMNIKKSVDEVVYILKETSQREGDLTRIIISASNDEIGDLAYWFNKFTRNLRGIIKKIIEHAEFLEKSSDELAKFSLHLSEGAENMSSQSNMAATSSEEMSANISSAAAFMEQAEANVYLVASATEEMTSSINEIAGNSEKARIVSVNAVSYARNASSKVDALGEVAKDISKITGVIAEISEQTNLLALNATIEAARAGDAGRSFAVVASEIKELAGQTAAATQEIRERIQGIQLSTTGTITEIKKISEVIEDVNGIVEGIAAAVEEQAVTTREIAGNIAQASEGNQEVSKKVAESASVSKGIARDVATVHDSANGIAEDSTILYKNAEELSRMAEQLKNIVDNFIV